MKIRETDHCDEVGAEITIVFGIGDRDEGEVVNLVASVLSGFTLTFGVGGWEDEKGLLRVERSAIVRVAGFTPMEGTRTALQLASVFDQEAIYVVVSGQAAIVTTKVVDGVNNPDG